MSQSRVRLVRAFYSPDGGGRWLPAVATTDTLTTALSTGYLTRTTALLPIPDGGAVTSSLALTATGQVHRLELALTISHTHNSQIGPPSSRLLHISSPAVRRLVRDLDFNEQLMRFHDRNTWAGEEILHRNAHFSVCSGNFYQRAQRDERRGNIRRRSSVAEIPPDRGPIFNGRCP